MNEKKEMYDNCLENPSKIFYLINKGEFDIINELIDNKKIDINICDTLNNSLCIRLYKAKQYDLVLKIIKRRNFNVNYQNDDGDTFCHYLLNNNDVRNIKLIEALCRKNNFNPNIKNNNEETSFDKAINNNYFIGALKLFTDKRFDLFTIESFSKFYFLCLKDSSYGKNTKIDNFKIIFKSLKKKKLDKNLAKFVEKIELNIETIKYELSINKNNCLDLIFNNTLQTA